MAGDQFSPEAFAFKGGIDLVTPALSITPGKLLDSLNYEPDMHGGYRRMYGNERFDGHPSPSSQVYWLQTVVISGTIAVGNTVTGATSGATAVVLQVNGTTEIIVTKLTGTFVAENLTVAAVVQATVSSTQRTGATTAALHASYLSLAANLYRADIAKVPGSGVVRGAVMYNNAVYAFRDNVGGTAGVMYKSTASGWSVVALSQTIAFAQRQSTVTITIAAPGVVTWNGHAIAANQAVTFSTTGTLPTGITAGVAYYVLAPAANTFTFAATSGGASITTSGTQTGVHTCKLVGIEIAEGSTITGATSGATGLVGRALLRTGTWTTDPVGTFQLDSNTGTFTSGEALQVGGQTRLSAAGANTAITLAPGGRYEFELYNFSGNTTSMRLYGVDGKNLAFEYDGTRYVPIPTGLHVDTPTYLAAWKNALVFAYGSNIEISGPGAPYAWTALTGAAAIALGANCSGMKAQAGNETMGALAIWAFGNAGTSGISYILYGNDSTDFNLVTQSSDSGAQPYTAQNIGYAFFLDTKGICQLNSTRNYGNFDMSTVSRAIQPLIDQQRGLATASCIVRSSNQYRVFFSDGTGLIMYVESADENLYAAAASIKVGAFMRFSYSLTVYFNTVASCVDSTGVERIFAGGSDGYVYELERGTSFDGAVITSHLLTSFNTSRTPMSRKTYKRTVIQATCMGTASVTVGYNLSYANTESAEGARTTQSLIGGGGWWDSMIWDTFNWDAPYLTDYTIDTPGNGTNINYAIFGSNAVDLPYTINSVIVTRKIGRMER